MNKLQVVVGGQFGSEGKGAIAGYLCREEEFHDGLAIRVAGPNAGHSAVGVLDGKKWALRQVPVAAVTNPRAWLGIAPGSEIDPEVLLSEVDALDAAGYDVARRLWVDESATVITPDDKDTEKDLVRRIGSTGKGIGAARAARLLRDAPLAYEVPAFVSRFKMGHVAGLAAMHLRSRKNVLVEGTQGYGLGLHSGYYPQVTSSDCRAIDFLAMAGINPWAPHGKLEVWVVVRPYPIRVAGDSGPLLAETTWEALGLPVEKTTVTQKTRRVGGWNGLLVREALLANGGPGYPVRVAFTMADQIDPSIGGSTSGSAIVESWRGDYLNAANTKAGRWVSKIEGETGGQVWLVGTGPDTLIDLRGRPGGE